MDRNHGTTTTTTTTATTTTTTTTNSTTTTTNNNDSPLLPPKILSGIGSPHARTQIAKNIWPMATAIQGLVSTNITEKVELIELLANYMSGGTHWMHESIDPDMPEIFTRPWFCWADALYAELVLSVLPPNDGGKGGGCPDPNYQYQLLESRDPNVVPVTSKQHEK